MAYDVKLDIEFFKEVKEFEKTRMTVGIFSYNGGEKKFHISRERKQGEGWRFEKLGRIRKEEGEWIAGILRKGIEEWGS